MKTKQDKKKQGKRNRASGAAWERKVRADLEKRGWFVSKFQNNVEFYSDAGPVKNISKEETESGTIIVNSQQFKINGRMIPAKRKYNPFKKALSVGTGFPDFICWRTIPPTHVIFNQSISPNEPFFDVIGVEAKSNGYLDKTEKAKCKWLLANKIFNSIEIAKKKKVGRVIVEYVGFKEK